MKTFADLYTRLDRSTATGDKRAALVDYFRVAPPADAAWALWLLAGGKVAGGKAGILARSGELRQWIAEASHTPEWLVQESHDQVGDLARARACHLQAIGDVGLHGLPREKPEMLKHHRNAGDGLGDALAVDDDFAFIERKQAIDTAQERSLAAA